MARFNDIIGIGLGKISKLSNIRSFSDLHDEDLDSLTINDLKKLKNILINDSLELEGEEYISMEEALKSLFGTEEEAGAKYSLNQLRNAVDNIHFMFRVLAEDYNIDLDNLEDKYDHVAYSNVIKLLDGKHDVPRDDVSVREFVDEFLGVVDRIFSSYADYFDSKNPLFNLTEEKLSKLHFYDLTSINRRLNASVDVLGLTFENVIKFLEYSINNYENKDIKSIAQGGLDSLLLLRSFCEKTESSWVDIYNVDFKPTLSDIFENNKDLIIKKFFTSWDYFVENDESFDYKNIATQK